MSVLTLSGARFKYHGAEKPILNGIDMTLEQGQAIQVSGPSGSGKTTLCLMACAIIPSRLGGEFYGRAELMGQPTAKLGPSGASDFVGYVMQDPEFSMLMPSVEDEIAFGLENRGWEPQQITSRVEELMGDLGMRSLSGRNPQRLSGGEKQLVAIAAAVAHHPSLLVIDESFSSLDEDKREQVVFELGRMKKNGTAILMVEHLGIGRLAPFWLDSKLWLEGGSLTEAAGR